MARYRFVCEVIRIIINISLISYISGFLSHYGRCHHSYHGSIQFIFVNQYYYIPIRIIIVNGVIKWEWGGGQGLGLGLGLANSYNNTFDTNLRYNLGPFFPCVYCAFYGLLLIHLGVTSKKKNSIFKDIVQIGGREVNPMSKILKGMNF